VLVFAIITGLILGDILKPLADISLYTLALVMVISTTGFTLKSWLPVQRALRDIVYSSFLSYFLFGGIVILSSYLIFGTNEYWVGFVIIAITPPGVAIIPFTSMLKGNIDFSITGVFGAHITAMIIAPITLLLLLGKSAIEPFEIFMVLVKLVIIPLIISRFLRHKKTIGFFDKYRGKLTNWGFYFVIAPIVGLNRDLLFSDWFLVLKILSVFIIGMVVLGFFYQYFIYKQKMLSGKIISTTLLLTIKSSAFAAVTAYTYFGEKAALPAAVMSVFVIVYFLIFPFINKQSFY